MLVWDSLWDWVSYFTHVTCPALMMFLTTCFSSCEFFTLTLGVSGPQLAVVFFKSSYSSAFLCNTRVACLRRKQWVSVLKNGISLRIGVPLFIVISFSLHQSKCNSLFFCSYSCWKCECSSPSRQDIQFCSEDTVKLGPGISWLKFRKSKYSGCRTCKSACRPSWDLSLKSA